MSEEKKQAQAASLSEPSSKSASQTSAVARKKTAPKTAAVANPGLPVANAGTVKVFQWATPATPKAQQDPALTPLLLKDASDPLLWAKACVFLMQSEQLQDVAHWGVLPAGFTQKLALSGADLVKQIQDNPGFDVYIANPHLEVEALYQNLWVQGEISHPGLMGIAAQTFKSLGLDPATLALTLPGELTVTANAVVGNERFWKAYLAFLDAVLDRCKQLPAEHQKRLFEPSADPKGLHPGQPNIGFITERLLSDFLRVNQNKLKVFKLRSPVLEAKLGEYVTDLRVLKQTALDQQSQALLQAWSSYRTLFLTVVKGKDWVVANAKALGVILK